MVECSLFVLYQSTQHIVIHSTSSRALSGPFRKGLSSRIASFLNKPIVDSATKETTLVNAMAELGLSAGETMAVGDGANDLAMIRQAVLGVAYHAKPIVAAAAGARIDHGDLTALLYAQGIARHDWVMD